VIRHWAVFLAVLLPLQAADPAILQIRIVEGEGLAYAVGSRATRGITVQIADETGKPVEGATVSFRLPEDGPGGSFSSGSKTEVATTGADGRVSVWGMLWNRTPGAFEVRITAAKAQARAGAVTSLYLNDAPISKAERPDSRIGAESSHKWLWIGLAVAGVAGAATAALAGKSQSSTPAANSQIGVPTIGTPTISVGKP
jgi:hypothetical protein